MEYPLGVLHGFGTLLWLRHLSLPFIRMRVRNLLSATQVHFENLGLIVLHRRSGRLVIVRARSDPRNWRFNNFLLFGKNGGLLRREE